MTPVKQTPGKGDCLRAAVASILDLNLHEVPHFAESADGVDNPRWEVDLIEWARERSLGTVFFPISTVRKTVSLHKVTVILVGKTKRGTGKDDHAVVAHADAGNGYTTFEYLHDPHESNAMIDQPKYGLFFVGVAN